ncbi:hypothetical protein K5D69_18805 [Pseudomonas cichorii]|uniref:hypothetical protein n=1 Tax=Pseudomonas cichorii TaxID=36746 RepID=UPI001C89D670|nr:hypothetical protein [Pseudomonas cichorii]MBX8516733.1 hypothetical protein [Pseudomonas cichorii]MBX8531575.1 hypothetical protein [Pseudomonas cichorii]
MQQSYINAGSLFFFSSGVSPSFMADVLDCSLYSQLAASAKHEKFVEPVEWRQTYLNALTRFRCNIVYREVQDAPLEYAGSLWAYTREKLARRVSLSLVERAECILKRFADGTESEATTALLAEQTTHCLPVLALPEPTTEPDATGQQDCSVILQLAFVDVEPVVNLIILTFKSTPPAGELPLAQLFAELGSVKGLEIAHVSAELDEHGFGYFRKDLIARMGARRDKLIVALREDEP